MKKVAYLAIDVHARNCVLGHLDFDGTFLGNRRFPTSEHHIIQALKAVKAKEKYVALEESNLAYWAACCQLLAASFIFAMPSALHRRASSLGRPE